MRKTTMGVLGLAIACSLCNCLLPVLPQVGMNRIMYIDESRAKVLFTSDILILLINPGGSSWTSFHQPFDFQTPILNNQVVNSPVRGVKINSYTVTSDKLTVDVKNAGDVTRYIMTFDWDNETVDLKIIYPYMRGDDPSGRYKIVTINADSPDSAMFYDSFERSPKTVQAEPCENRHLNPHSENTRMKSRPPINDTIRELYTNDRRRLINSSLQR